MSSRRKFIANSVGAVVGALAAPKANAGETAIHASFSEEVNLCGEWLFRTDPDNLGTQKNWYKPNAPREGWQTVTVPHTWQVEAALADYRGLAWYRRTFDLPPRAESPKEVAVRVEFEAVFHTATVWINGQLAGEHARKGYAAFTLDITSLLQWGRTNTIAVRVDSAFNQHMVPRGRSSDWAHDGGIFRPVRLLITPKTFVERVDVEAVPDLARRDGKLTITAHIRNTSAEAWNGKATFRVAQECEPLTVLTDSSEKSFPIRPGDVETLTLRATLPNAKLWHFDHPHLYRLDFSIADAHSEHCFTTAFGVRKLEVRDGAFYLNGERVRLMGVERMAGSNPEFGMAEPVEWIAHDHADMKHLNCIFTRVHWPQDKRVLDYCDRHGILMQTEVPAWGPDTFGGMTTEPDADIMENALEQLREMIARDFNHPSVVVWGLCNEIEGQNSPAYQFAKRLLEEAKRLDPGRLCSYASNSLDTTPQRDVAGLMDFIEANEYYGTWAPGTAADAARYLDGIHAAFPGKPVVVSEYGYCACTPDRPEGDEPRMEILRSHDAAIRSRDFVGGAIFFCYNDYRTHVGDRGVGSLRQRVHGVVDLFGTRKPSYALLRQESSPIESMTVERQQNKFQVSIRVQRDLPMYTLRGYQLRGVFYGQGNIPVEQREVNLPDAAPGSETKLELVFTQSQAPVHVEFDILRPTSFSAYFMDWKP
ncbi:MAG: glycoside hydrolase family 2 protein [Candidatus Sulfotelmatobacter sp.]